MKRPFLLAMLLLAGPAQAERTVMLSGFDRVRVDGPFEVEMRAGPRAAASIAGSTRAAEAVTARVENRTLIVSASVSAWGGWRGEERPAVVTITAPPETRGVAVRGGGRVHVDRLRGGRLDLAVAGSGTLVVDRAEADLVYVTLTGAGRVELAGQAARARFLSIGTGSIDADQFAADELQVSSDSLGDSRFTARRTATVSSTGLGAVTVDGPAACTITGQRGGPVTCGREARRP